VTLKGSLGWPKSSLIACKIPQPQRPAILGVASPFGLKKLLIDENPLWRCPLAESPVVEDRQRADVSGLSPATPDGGVWCGRGGLCRSVTPLVGWRGLVLLSALPLAILIP
jgi:hypothetical protein